MHHIEGFEVLMKHDGLPYDETLVPRDKSLWMTFYPENTVLQGRFNTPVSQVAIHRTSSDPRATEHFDLSICFYSVFNFYSANALQVSVCMKEGQVLKEWSTVLWKADFADGRVSYTLMRQRLKLPAPWKTGAKASKTWKRRFSADPGSVTVFVSRGKADETHKVRSMCIRLSLVATDVVAGNDRRNE